MADSIFTKIIKGEIPSHKIYEDDKTFAFMDIHPIQPGHVLLVPKAQVPTVWELSYEDYKALTTAMRKIARKLQQVFPDKKRIGIIIEGLEMLDHAHVKIFPINSGDELRHLPDPDAEPDHSALAALAEKLKIGDNE